MFFLVVVFVLAVCWVAVLVLVVKLAVVFVLGPDFQCFGLGHCFCCHVCSGLFLLLCSLPFCIFPH